MASDMSQSNLARARLSISGRVQGVGFRYSTCVQADALGVHGWVRNLPDGRVEVVAEGPRDVVEHLIAWSHEGPLLARVRDVDVSWEDARDEPSGFRVV